MRLIARYVLFYCDDCDLLAPAIAVFTSIHKSYVILQSSDRDDFIAKLHTYAPELILIYTADAAHDIMSLVREVRESPTLSSVPLLVYKQLPDADQLLQAFQQLKKFET